MLVWGCSNFLTLLFNTCPSISAQSGVFKPISTFYTSLESLKKKADCTIFAKKLCIDFCTNAFKENFHIFSFPWIQICFLKILQILLHSWICRGKGYLKMYDLSYFAHFLFLHFFCILTWYWNKYLKFCKFANFLQIMKVEPKNFPKLHQILYRFVSQ